MKTSLKIIFLFYFLSIIQSNALADKMYAWGNFIYDTDSTSRKPLQIGKDSDWKIISGTSDHILAIKENGTLWAWGYNYYGQLGDSSNLSRRTFVQITNDNNWKSVSAGNEHSLALKNDGTLWAWGENYQGQLGDSTSISKNYPVQVGIGNDWESISCFGSHSAAIKKDGTLWVWGKYKFNIFGTNKYCNKNPVKIGDEHDWKEINCSRNHVLALKNDGSIWGYGIFTFVKNGDTIACDTTNFIPCTDSNVAVTLYRSCYNYYYLNHKGELWGWGANKYGSLGDSTTEWRLSPVKIGSDTNWKAVSGGYDHSHAIKNDGSLWSWGRNTPGSLGDNSYYNKLYPIQIGNGMKWTQVAACYEMSFALAENGTDVEYNSKEIDSQISFFPNPANNFVQIQLPNEEQITQIEIFNTLGEKFMPKINSNVIDLHDIPSGIYTAFVKTNTAMDFTKLVIIK